MARAAKKCNNEVIISALKKQNYPNSWQVCHLLSSLCISHVWLAVHYSMIIWNCQKVNHSNSALKPLPRLHNVPKVAYVWDILIFQAFGTSWSTGKFQVAYLWLETIEENLRKCTKIDPLRIPFDTLTPQLYPRTLPNTLRHLKLFPMSPRSGPDHSHALVRQLESQRVWISIKFLQCWPTFSSSNKPHETPQ